MTRPGRRSDSTFPTSVMIVVALLLWLPSPLQADQAYELDGLEKPAEIIVDRWGVPHIYAGTHYDAFFVQGFNAARDRLWQIDLWRKRGLGLLSESFGDRFVDQDRANRLFLYRGDMYREWLAYGSDAKRIAEAFAGHGGILPAKKVTPGRFSNLPGRRRSRTVSIPAPCRTMCLRPMNSRGRRCASIRRPVPDSSRHRS